MTIYHWDSSDVDVADGWPVPRPKRGHLPKYLKKCVTCDRDLDRSNYIGPHCLACLNVLRDYHEKEEKQDDCS